MFSSLRYLRNVTRTNVEKTDEKELILFFFFSFSSRNCGPHCVSGKRKHRIITKRVDRFRHRHSRDDCFASFLRFISVQGTYKLRIITTIASRRRKLTVIKSRIASERDPLLKRERETLVASKPRGERVRPTS